MTIHGVIGGNPYSLLLLGCTHDENHRQGHDG